MRGCDILTHAHKYKNTAYQHATSYLLMNGLQNWFGGVHVCYITNGVKIIHTLVHAHTQLPGVSLCSPKS